MIPGAPGGGHHNPVQSSCLENPMHRGARWAAVRMVAQSQTQLKRLNSSSSNVTEGRFPGVRHQVCFLDLPPTPGNTRMS